MEKVFFDGEFGKICGVLYKANDNGKIVIVVHGFSSNKETSAKGNADYLFEHGINVMRIDLDNMGESELNFEELTIPKYIKQVEASMDFVRSRGFSEISLIGGSFGGIVSLGTAMSHPEIKKIFLRAPVLDFVKHFNKMHSSEEIEKFRSQGYFEYYKTRLDKYLKVNFDCYETAKNYSMYDHASEIKMPVLLAQGDNDEQVDYKVAIEVAPLFSNCRLEIIPGADHGLGVNKDHSREKELLLEFFSE